MKKDKQLPKFKTTTLRASDLKQVAGGMMIGGGGCGTAGTRSVCHIDGTDDADGVFALAK